MDEEFLQTGKGKGRCYRTSNHQPDRYPISGNLHFGSSGIGKHILGQSGWRQRSALLSATNDGTELNKRTGKYKDIFVVGFDSGSSQRKALKVGEFLGSATQDRYQMGYQAIELAAEGEKVSNSDTGPHWYDSSNIDNPDIAKLLHD